MRGDIPWEEDPEVNQNVVVVSFLPESKSTIATHRPCKPGYRLHCSDVRFQLYNKNVSDTFIFINRAFEPQISIALGKISSTVQRVSLFIGRNIFAEISYSQQLGRVNKTPVRAVEIHVVSNRDRVAHQLFDLWFDQ
jgi:hypothetical protein